MLGRHAFVRRNDPFLLEFACGDRFAKKVPLIFMASLTIKEFELLACFNTFSQYIEFERTRHHDNGLHNSAVVTISREITREALIDLEFGDRQALEITETGITGTEIIDRQIVTFFF